MKKYHCTHSNLYYNNLTLTGTYIQKNQVIFPTFLLRRCLHSPAAASTRPPLPPLARRCKTSAFSSFLYHNPPRTSLRNAGEERSSSPTPLLRDCSFVPGTGDGRDSNQVLTPLVPSTVTNKPTAPPSPLHTQTFSPSAF